MRYYLFTSSCTLAVFFVFHAALVAGAELSNDVVNVGVYYESLCPDSIRFIKNGLVPTYNALGKHLDVTLIPYGKASHKLSGNGEWQFSCQHGPEECQGNMAQACGLHAIQNKEPAAKVQQLSVALVGCVMSSRNPASSVPQCAESVGLSEQAKTSIDQCLNGALSKELLAANGEKTAALKPRLSFVPTISINGVTSQEIQNKALSNFLKLICDMLPANTNEAKCSNA